MKNLLKNNILLTLFISIHVLIVLFLLYPDFDKDTESPELKQTISIVENNLKSHGFQFERAEDISLSNMKRFSSDWVGVSVYNSYIKLKKDYFLNAPLEIREALLLHEYGHFLGISKHNNNYIYVHTKENGQACPESVMHESDNIAGCFDRMRSYYYQELINELLDTKSSL